MKKIVALLGLFLLILGVGVAVAINNIGQKAFSLDRYYPNSDNPRPDAGVSYTDPQNIIESSGQVKYSYDSANAAAQVTNPIYSMDLQISKRTIAEGETTALTVFLSNRDAQDSEDTVTLLAPGFSSIPADAVQKVTVPVGEKTASVTWILTPQKAGSYELGITSSKFHGTVVIGLVVTTVLGFTASQAQILSWISSILGPMLTVPWWFDLWQKRKQKDEEKEAKAEKK